MFLQKRLFSHTLLSQQIRGWGVYWWFILHASCIEQVGRIKEIALKESFEKVLWEVNKCIGNISQGFLECCFYLLLSGRSTFALPGNHKRKMGAPSNCTYSTHISWRRQPYAFLGLAQVPCLKCTIRPICTSFQVGEGGAQMCTVIPRLAGMVVDSERKSGMGCGEGAGMADCKQTGSSHHARSWSLFPAWLALHGLLQVLSVLSK